MATKGKKAIKKVKLRNAEYYDFQKIQDDLYVQSRENRIFQNLMSIVSSEDNIKLAYRNIKKNTGSNTAGTDNRTIRNLANLNVDKLITIVQNKLTWYVPQKVRRVEIPKDNDPTKKRPLGIPTIMDRLIQQCFLQVLEPICEAKFHERSNGFRPNRSAEHALAQAYKYINLSHMYFVVDIDVKSFFDNVNHGKLLKQMWTLGIRDKKLLAIISVMLKSEVAEIGFPKKGTPQGGIISPLLSNIVLNELDWWIASQWEELPTHTHKPHTRKDNGKQDKGFVYEKLRKTKLKECYIVRYADDFKIFCKTRSDAVKIFEATKLWLKERLNLDISPEKSKIVNLKQNYSEFLGFKLKAVAKSKKGGKIQYVVRSHVKDKAIAKIKDKLDKLIYDIEFPKQGKRAEYLAVSIYNAYVSGIHNYYDNATHIAEDFNKLAFSVHKSLKARLKKRVKSKSEMDKKKIPYTLPMYIKEKYGESGQLKFIGKNAIIPIGYIQHQKPLYKGKNINKYTETGRTEIHKKLQCVNIEILHYLMRNPNLTQTIEFNDNRLSLYSAQQGKCAITGQMLEIGKMHCHHKLPKHLGGKDNYDNLVLITDDMHRLVHATNKATIEKYMENLNPKQIAKVEKLRELAKVESCINTCQV